MKQVALLLAAPLWGALFVTFLPVIGFAMVGYALGLKLIQHARSAKLALAR